MGKHKRMIFIAISLVLLCCITLGLIGAYHNHKEKEMQAQQTRTFDVTMYCYEVSMSGVPLGKSTPFQLTGRSQWWTSSESKKKERWIDLEAWSVDGFNFPAQSAAIYETLSDEAFTVRLCRSSGPNGIRVKAGVMGFTEAFDGCVIITDDHYFVGSTNPNFDVEDVLQYFPDLPKLLSDG